MVRGTKWEKLSCCQAIITWPAPTEDCITEKNWRFLGVKRVLQNFAGVCSINCQFGVWGRLVGVGCVSVRFGPNQSVSNLLTSRTEAPGAPRRFVELLGPRGCGRRNLFDDQLADLTLCWK